MTYDSECTPIEILVIEDNEGDRFIIEQTFRECDHPYRLNVVLDGAQAIDFIKKQNNYKMAPDIHMMILDINLPRKSGMEVLQEVRKDLKTRHIPIIILTSSRSHREIMSFYQNYANCFLTKPIRLNEFTNLLKGIIAFWLNLVQLPR